MIQRLLFVTLCLAITLFSCEDNLEIEDPQPDPLEQLLLRVIMPINYPMDSAKYWTMIHDADGKLLDARRIASGDTVDFLTTAADLPDDLQFTFLSVDTSLVNETFYFFESYSLVATNSALSLVPFTWQHNHPGELANFKLTITDVEGGWPGSFHVSTNSGGASYDAYTSNTTIYMDASTSSPGIEHLVTVEDRGGHASYRFLETINEGDSLVVSASTFQGYDHYEEVSFPIYPENLFAQVIAYDPETPLEDGSGYQLLQSFHLLYGWEARTLPYLDRFSRYKTQVEATYENRTRLVYIKDGSRPSAPIKLTADMKPSLEDRTFAGFKVSPTTKAHEMRQTRFNYSASENAKWTHVQWMTYSPDLDRKALELPEALTTRYPTLDLNKLKHSSSRFYFDGKQYASFVDQRFHGLLEPEEKEYFAADVLE